MEGKMNKQTLKWIKEVSRNEFKDRRLVTRIIAKKPKRDKYTDYDNFDVDLDTDDFFFWKNPKKLSK